MDALEQYTHMVRTHQEEQQQLAEDHEARMAILVQGIKAAGLSDVLNHATSDVRPKRKMSSPSEDDVTPAEELSTGGKKQDKKREMMRIKRRDRWLREELSRLDSCSGAPKPKMRLWLTQLR